MTNDPQETLFRPLTETEQREIVAHAIALTTARRGGMPDLEFGQLVSAIYLELVDQDEPGASAMRHCYLTSTLCSIAAHACDHWDGSDAWLADLVTYSTDREGLTP